MTTAIAMPDMPEDTSERILAFICQHIDKYDIAPSIREIMKGCQIPSSSNVHYHLQKLEDEGRIKREFGMSRGITLPERKEQNYWRNRALAAENEVQDLLERLRVINQADGVLIGEVVYIQYSKAKAIFEREDVIPMRIVEAS